MRLQNVVFATMTLLVGSIGGADAPPVLHHIVDGHAFTVDLRPGNGQMQGVGPSRVFTNSLGMRFVPVAGVPALFCIWDTRVQDYQAFVRDTATKWIPVDFEQGPTHPAVNISWLDATHFCRWLSDKERRAGIIGVSQEYRLPTDAEWSIAAGLSSEAGSTPRAKSGGLPGVFPWGNGWPPIKKAGNYCDVSFFKKYREQYGLNSESYIHGYDDGFADTSPVTSFPANAQGLHDMGGNVWQWCEDWYDESRSDRVLRGASFTAVDPSRILLSFRYHLAPSTFYVNYGFRCVLVVAPRPCYEANVRYGR